MDNEDNDLFGGFLLRLALAYAGLLVLYGAFVLALVAGVFFLITAFFG